MTPDTPWSDLLLSEETTFERLLDYNPKIRNFRGVLNDERVAVQLTVGDVARMLGLPAEVLLRVARGQQAGTAGGAPAEPAHCDWAGKAPQTRSLDLRPIFADGHEPLAVILTEIGRLPREAALVIDVPFHPLPLRRLLEGRGYGSVARCLAADHWQVTFRQVDVA
ncbi:MAG: DUF2249 domain-containing protein [Thalassobaculum sp.]|uniref:DUF2249 domain-containing protein n=1 Tax=Thalassobaculum sp. TaxID=2022740 RepID=UPI0032F07EEB